MLLIYPVRTQKLQICDDVVNVVVCQDDETAQGRRTDRVLRFREIEEPLVMSDGVAERLGAVVVKIRRGVLDAPKRRDLELLREKGAGTANGGGTGGWLGSRTSVGCRRSPRSGDSIVTIGFTPSLMIHVRIGLLGALTISHPCRKPDPRPRTAAAEI